MLQEYYSNVNKSLLVVSINKSVLKIWCEFLREDFHVILEWKFTFIVTSKILNYIMKRPLINIYYSDSYQGTYEKSPS